MRENRPGLLPRVDSGVFLANGHRFLYDLLAVAGRMRSDPSPLPFETLHIKKFFDMFHLKPTGCVSLAFLLLSLTASVRSCSAVALPGRKPTERGKRVQRVPLYWEIWSSLLTHPPQKSWKRK